MTSKDVTQKTLESYNDVFSDIVNVLLFDGEKSVDPNDLSDANTFSYYKSARTIRSQDRDVAKFWSKGSVHIAFLGLENQTCFDSDMPLRVISYDGAAYRDQLRRQGSAAARFPVITMVLHLDHEGHWSRCNTLKDRLDIPKELDQYVSDYSLNVFEIAFLDESTINKFQSDFRVLADYCAQMQRTGKYIPDEKVLIHPKEVLEAMSAFTGNSMYEEVYTSFHKKNKKGRPGSMNDYLSIVKAEADKRIAEANSQAENGVNAIVMLINDQTITLERGASCLGITSEEMQQEINKRKHSTQKDHQ